MKTKLFLSALALPLVFGACSNDELISTDTPAQKGDLVEVGPNFVISATKGGKNDATRAVWEKEGNSLNFLWKPIAPAADGPAILDRIGLCWVGNAASDVVYTNYEFVHAGWLAKEEMKAEVDPCTGLVKNGYNFGEVTYATTGSKFVNTDSNGADDDILATANLSFDENGSYVNFASTNTNNKVGDYNLRSAFFKTSAQTLFGGNYIAYSPFNKDFKDQGHIQATSPVVFDVNLTSDDTKFAHLGEAMFAYGYAPNLVGGTSASDFSFNNLSGLIRVRVTGDMQQVEAVALVDANSNFVKKVGLDAQKIIGGVKGTGLYVASEKETINILTANVTGGTAGTAGSTNDVYFSALPTTTGALKVVLYNGTKSAVFDAAAIEVKEGALVNIDVTVTAADFNKNVAITEDALADMIAAEVSPITLLGDLKLTDDLEIDKAVTIEGGKIIVPRAKGSNPNDQIVLSVTANATVNSAIETENKGCCDDFAGKLEIGATTGNVKAVLGGTIDNWGEMEFVKGAAVATKNITTVKGQINNNNEEIELQDETLYGSVKIDEFAVVELQANVKNEGVINIIGTGVVEKDGTLNVAAGKTVTNAHEMVNAGNINNRGKVANTADGWFIDKIGSQFGLTQFNNDANGQYVCEVNGQNRLNDALSTNYPTTRVRFVNLLATGIKGTTKSYAFDMKNSKNTIDVEIAMDEDALTAKDTVVLKTTSTTAAIAMKNLIVTSGNMQIVSKAAIEENLTVDGKNAKDVDLLGEEITVKGDVVLNQMAAANDATSPAAPQVKIGGTQNATTKVYTKTTMNVEGKFVVGDATPKSTKKAAVKFLNNNETNITGAFDLNKPGLCTIDVASSESVDNNAAFVWASAVNENGGKWGNGSKVKIKVPKN